MSIDFSNIPDNVNSVVIKDVEKVDVELNVDVTMPGSAEAGRFLLSSLLYKPWCLVEGEVGRLWLLRKMDHWKFYNHLGRCVVLFSELCKDVIKNTGERKFVLLEFDVRQSRKGKTYIKAFKIAPVRRVMRILVKKYGNVLLIPKWIQLIVSVEDELK